MKLSFVAKALGLTPTRQQLVRARDLTLEADVASYEASRAKSAANAETWEARAKALRQQALQQLREGPG